MTKETATHRPPWWRREPVRFVRRILEPLFNPVRLLHATVETPGFIAEFLRFRRASAQNGTPVPALRDLHPVFGQSGAHEFDSHYIYLNGWAARRIISAQPSDHVDVGSQLAFTSMLGALLPVKVVEFRPVPLALSGMDFVEGSILSLPFSTDSVRSLSTLHVIEHIGLGRYGDPIDPLGTVKAAGELARVLAPGGQLLVGLPMGRPRTCFNAHRIHDSRQVLDMFAGLRLIEFAGVDDSRAFAENRPIAALDQSDYACGFFRFTK